LLSSEDEDSEDDYDSDFPPSSQPDSTGGASAGITSSEHLDMSNVGWKDVDEEFAEYFGDDDFEESDSDASSAVGVRRKRRAGALEEGGEDGGNASGGDDSEMEDVASAEGVGSKLAKRRKVARERAAAGSALRGVEVSVTGTEEGGVAAAIVWDEGGGDGDGDGEDNSLAEELERELIELDGVEEEQPTAETKYKAKDGG
jgi:hypothetical protein